MSESIPIHGHCDPRFEGVRKIFADGFASGPELGASVAFTIDGESVVDLWGGYVDKAREREWERDTLVNVYSTTKGAFKAVLETNWRGYALSQAGGALPQGPLVIMVHMASVWVPFTSESKEAIADYDEIRKEVKLALQECGRKLGIYLRRRKRMQRESQPRRPAPSDRFLPGLVSCF